MTLSFLKYLNGHVIIRIDGPMPEKFINLCITEGILLWNIKSDESSMYAYLQLADFLRIRALVRKTRNHIKVVGCHGFPFVAKRVKRRKMIALGALLFFITLNFLTAHIWFVDVKGIKTIPLERVTDIARQHGLSSGNIKDKERLQEIENRLMLEIPEIAWVGINYTGTRAVIEIVEKTMPQQEDKAPADIVAAKDAVITEIIVLNGQPKVKKDDTVKAGDVLIRGIVPPPEEKEEGIVSSVEKDHTIQLTKAKGIVKGRVWYESYGEAAMTEDLYTRTGQKDIGVYLRIGDAQFIVREPHPGQYSSFEEQTIYKKLPRWRNSGFAVESTIKVYHELQVSHREYTFEEARDRAKSKALSAMQSVIPESAQILSRDISVINIPDTAIVRVKVSVEAIEDIGQDVNTLQ